MSIATRPGVTQTQFQSFGLGQGLVLGGAPLLMQPGSLRSCLNYEAVDSQGIDRIPGFSRFDGVHNTAVSSWFIIRLGVGPDVVDQEFGVGTVVRKRTGPWTGIIVESSGSTVTVVAATDSAIDYKVGDILENRSLVPAVVSEISTSTESTAPTESLLRTINDINGTLRGLVPSLEAAPVGAFLFKNTSSVITEELVIAFQSGATEVFPGDAVTVQGLEYTVLGVTLTGGSWGTADASGSMTVSGPDGVPTSGDIFLVPGRLNQASAITVAVARPRTAVDRPLGSGIREAIRLAQVADPIDAGWKRVASNTYSIRFLDGLSESNTLPTVDKRSGGITGTSTSVTTRVDGSFGIARFARTGVTLPGDVAPTPGLAPAFAAMVGSPLTASTLPADILSSIEQTGDLVETQDGISGALILDPTLPRAEGSTTVSSRLMLSRFAFDQVIPEDAEIVGIELFLNEVDTPAQSPTAAHGWAQFSIQASVYKHGATDFELLGDPKTLFITNKFGESTPSGDFVLGGENDSWGALGLSGTDVISGEFGVSLNYSTSVQRPATAPDPSLGDLIRVAIGQIKFRITYRTKRSRVFFKSATSGVVSADLISYRVFQGRLETGTASGVLQVSNLDSKDSSRGSAILPGSEIFSDPSLSTAFKIGTVDLDTTAVTANMLPSKAELLLNSSKFLFVSANFFGDEAFEGIYGVSGAGRAFSWDGNFLLTIYSFDDAEKDRPRHIAFHHFHLALGYKSGQLMFSQPGEPEVFDGFRGAFELGIGDRITGLASLPGSSLAVFGESSIVAITGTSQDNMSTQTISPKSGAIEYTVVDLADPVYCDFRGVASIQMASSFGTFSGRRLSGKVSRWLRPRLRTVASAPDVVAASGIVGAIPFRAKNLYKLFFKDGYALSMTLFNEDPVFTIQRYFLGQDESVEQEGHFFEPFAWSSGVDATGRDRVHIIHQTDAGSSPAELGQFVYEFDSGWSFDGNYIPHYAELNPYYGESPTSSKTLKGVVVEGSTTGVANIGLRVGEGLVPRDPDEGLHKISMPEKPGRGLSTDSTPSDSVTQVQYRARSFIFRLEGVPKGSSAIQRLNNPQPGYSIQALLVRLDGSGAQEI